MPEVINPSIIIFVIVFVACLVSFYFYSKRADYKDGENINRNENYKKEKVLITKEYGKISLAGVTFRNLDGSYRQTIIRRCAKILDGHMEREVYFHAEKEPQNKYDKNAVRVFVEESWQTSSGDFKDKYLGVIGYFPKYVAEDIAIEFEHVEDEPTLFLSEAEIFEFDDEKGKQKVGISFTLTASWYELPNDEEQKVKHDDN